MSDMISKAKFGAHMARLTDIPEGFTAKLEVQRLGWGTTSMLVYVVKSDTVEIRFDQTGNGHTLFMSDGVQLCFDRLGVEDSFYHLPMWNGDTTEYDLNAILKEQLDRVENYMEYKKTALAVPGIPFTISPDRLADLKSKLASGKPITFMPSGFGTGYEIRKGTVRGAKRAPKAMETFFGASPLSVSTLECD